MLKYLQTKLKRTHDALLSGLKIFSGKKIDQALFDELENSLILADVGVGLAKEIIQTLQKRSTGQNIDSIDALLPILQEVLLEILEPYAQPLAIPGIIKPFIILVVGVNGVGKTTTIAKIANALKKEGKKITLAAGDTFRAAAIEQLQSWGDVVGVPIIAQQAGADSAAVIYDAIESAQSRKVDVVIADTAGRLHTQNNLMDELRKVKRTIAKLDSTAPHEVLLILDASIGQNSLAQVAQFKEAVGVTGLAVTKLDGTAKGGILFAIAKELKTPIRYVGFGEQIEDLQPFDAKEFVNALFQN
jgi:fused signal recognition particle receptor